MSPNPWRQTPADLYSPPHHLAPPLTPCCTVHSPPPSHAHSIPSAQHVLPCTPPTTSTLHPSTSFCQGVPSSFSALLRGLFPDPLALDYMPWTSASGTAHHPLPLGFSGTIWSPALFCLLANLPPPADWQLQDGKDSMHCPAQRLAHRSNGVNNCQIHKFQTNKLTWLPKPTFTGAELGQELRLCPLCWLRPFPLHRGWKGQGQPHQPWFLVLSQHRQKQGAGQAMAQPSALRRDQGPEEVSQSLITRAPGTQKGGRQLLLRVPYGAGWAKGTLGICGSGQGVVSATKGTSCRMLQFGHLSMFLELMHYY